VLATPHRSSKAKSAGFQGWCPLALLLCCQVDAGSDEEQQILEGLPATEASLSAAERHARQQPLLALCRGYRQRRVTLGDDRRQYDDEAEVAAGGVTSPRWDLHSVAESMQQVIMLVAWWPF